MKRKAYASAKLKELQPTAQADTVAAHLLLSMRTNCNRNNYDNFCIEITNAIIGKFELMNE